MTLNNMAFDTEGFKKAARSKGFSEAQIQGELTRRGVSTQSILEKPSKNLLGKAGSALDFVFGGKKVGEAIGTQIAKLTVPKEQKQFIDKGPSAKQILGDIGGMALTVGTLGSGSALKTGAKVVSKVAPKLVSKATQTAIKSSLIQKTLPTAKNVALGTGFGASEALKENKGVIGSSALGGFLSGSVPLVGKAVSFGAK